MTPSAFVVVSLALVSAKYGICIEDETFINQIKNQTEKHLITTIIRRDIIHDSISSSDNMVETRKLKTKFTNPDVIVIDGIAYNKNVDMIKNLEIHKYNINKVIKIATDPTTKRWEQLGNSSEAFLNYHKRYKRDEDPEIKCEAFDYRGRDRIRHPHGKDTRNNFYYKNADCITVIKGAEGTVVQLTFVDVFHIEYHPECAYDYLEIRDGLHGYASLLARVCGEAFPPQFTSSGPNLWLKFHSDDTIEYEGFHISVKFIQSSTSHNIPETCYKKLSGMHGVIDTAAIDPDCISRTAAAGQALDVLWTVESPEGTKIYLNFTSYSLAKPNECEDNVVQVFGSVLEFPAKLAHYCGSVANSVTTKGGEKGGEDRGNIMYVRLYASKAAKSSSFNATFTAYRALDPNKDEKCQDTEFDCEDNTCIALELKCDRYAHCRLKADEDYELCKGETESVLSQPHIMLILIVFSLIVSAMTFVFLFKCIRKLYRDHKIIKEHIKQSCEDRLDRLVESRFHTLDAKRLEMEHQPRASLERENQTNEMFKQQRNLCKPASIESDFVETQIEDRNWRRDVESMDIEPENVYVDTTKRKDISKKEESLRSKSRSESGEKVQKKEIRDAAVLVPDTKESGCQTRESLFGVISPPGSDSSASYSRGFSTFGYSGVTVPSPSPPPALTSQVTIELLQQSPQHGPAKTHKKNERRPLSTETTRSAPDVIIVSKPIR